MKTSGLTRISIVVLATFVVFATAFAVRTFTEARSSAEESAQLALLDEAVSL